MPLVGTGKNAKHFPYTKDGEEAAEKFAKKSGKPLTKMDPKKAAKKK